MTLRDRFAAFLPRVAMPGFAYQIRWVLTAPGVLPTSLTLIAPAPNPTTGQVGECLSTRVLPMALAHAPDRELAAYLVQRVLDFIDHEARECLTVDGVRLLDPHA